jgi:hypothetical protein
LIYIIVISIIILLISIICYLSRFKRAIKSVVDHSSIILFNAEIRFGNNSGSSSNCVFTTDIENERQNTDVDLAI